MKLDPRRFDDWFVALNGYEPFPWQRRLFKEWLCPVRPEDSRWPETVCLPTASGKTALIELSIFALAAGADCARRRIAFVVDRRVVVDEAAKRARALKRRLDKALDASEDPLKEVAESLMALGGEEPLVVATLRGGTVADDAWARSPVQPAVILSTVDQVGSRLLFRAYGGGSPRSWPIHAGLLGRDTLIIVDEAHCATPFCETLESVEKRWQAFSERQVGKPLCLVRMSATLAEEPEFELDSQDRSNGELARRLNASKPAELVPVKSSRKEQREKLVREAVRITGELVDEMDAGVIGVVVNRVADARSIYDQLDLPGDQKILLTGRVRGWERDRLLGGWLPKIHAGSCERPARPSAVVSTQCIEVGADIDFDALVTEIAPLDALRQRFGRLNRLGTFQTTKAFITAAETQVSSNGGEAKNPDPVYGHTLHRTWTWLSRQSEASGGLVDFGIEALNSILPGTDELAGMCQGVEHAHVLLPAHLDLLVQTGPLPAQSPSIAAYLHGDKGSSPDVTVIWRSGLGEEDTSSWVEAACVQPPATGEGCPVPVWEFKRWMDGLSSDSDSGDIEGAPAVEETGSTKKPVLCWRGPEESIVCGASEIKPGETVVVPSEYGGCDEFGWNPQSGEPVTDIGDIVAAGYRKPVLRLDAAAMLIGKHEGSEVVRSCLDDIKRLALGDEEAPSVEESLRKIKEVDSSNEWVIEVKKIANRLSEDRGVKLVPASNSYALVGSRGRGQDANTSGFETATGVEVELAQHCKGVSAYAGRFSAGLSGELKRDIELAASLHDVGKADPRFQVYLRGGNEIAAAAAGTLIAKSALSARDRRADRVARQLSGYPTNARHEAQSLALLQGEGSLLDAANDKDLVMHLIASHHGYARPFFPVVNDVEPVDVELALNGVVFRGKSDHEMYRIDSGVPERFWRLVRKYGWWGLSYLEAVVRLSDHRCSEDERTGGG